MGTDETLKITRSTRDDELPIDKWVSPFDNSITKLRPYLSSEAFFIDLRSKILQTDPLFIQTLGRVGTIPSDSMFPSSEKGPSPEVEARIAQKANGKTRNVG